MALQAKQPTFYHSAISNIFLNCTYKSKSIQCLKSYLRDSEMLIYASVYEHTAVYVCLSLYLLVTFKSAELY